MKAAALGGVVMAAMLSGCVSLGGKPPKMLLTVTSSATPVASDAAMATPISNALIIQQPTAPQTLRTPRIPVQTGATDLAYVKDAQWVEPPARMFQRLLTESISAQGNRLVLNESENITGPGEVLTGELMQFGVNADTSEAVVTFNALRIQGGGAQIVQRRFEARERLSRVEAAEVGAALNRAANRVAQDVAQWVGPGR